MLLHPVSKTVWMFAVECTEILPPTLLALYPSAHPTKQEIVKGADGCRATEI